MKLYITLQNYLEQRLTRNNIKHDWKISINPPSTKLLLLDHNFNLTIPLSVLEDNKPDFVFEKLGEYIDQVIITPGNYIITPNLNIEKIACSDFSKIKKHQMI